MSLRNFFQKLVSSKTSGEKEKINPPKVVPVIKFNSEGVPYRDCTQCEGKMYKKGNVWICDLLGNRFEE
ncbi:MAG: hypothetical protein A3I26_02305 [Candidatus Yanofskybacteria bacterium RIFCSPLOWO2_02_FULL_43_10]|uniref:Uncharacterized protein n=1 Tax=Candidatus Yanofskybacteria bacterium RIFCSPLOWO2_12_FULL_43_11b TaxID=1802710 RepID=A0A1F8HAQ1_9BACT|nr:MAG: hypothetical protein A2742_03770 [Candidatus Yanofskybacteria bacterium RIFCSPHIGHO2_01_FULL_43_32]OGN11105.1 MAG: hypothetical protein A3C69_00250 [Candidatus Yanofskybacteria bacterium RIFCSPHIGHO2_02_FULL_43_12]OGN17232.1 MAG: hypothetical protein A3E34_00040 [Candidatus Yanofskybacteria bacterium RIFCSPHIGHO2_12_FULL_43_11]OGN24963.1 MAG: hypothetical protein A2923_03270 [Candidatus Yanofskybacteria bacterium RIFCSPLOWO2_01_FULL_43_46]OGN30124.1 MAG: hypothetical protein A3I26_02305